MEQFTEIVFTSVVQAMQLLGVTIILGFIMLNLGQHSFRNLTIATNFNNTFMWLAYIGTPIHEFGHYIMCKIFFYKVTKVVWVQKPDLHGTLGYVNFTYNTNSLYQRIGRFFVGVGPLFSGTLALYLSLRLLLPQEYHHIMKVIKGINPTFSWDTITSMYNLAIQFFTILFTKDTLSHPQLYLFLFLAICITSHMHLSKSDLESAKDGILTIILVIIGLNVISAALTKIVPNLTSITTKTMLATVTHWNALFLALSTFSIAIGVATLVATTLLRLVKCR